jgi:hypothetical protein
VESWLAVATLQQRQHLGNLQDASRPAVDEEERNGSLDIALLVDEMHVDWSMFVDVDLNLVVRECVELGFVRAPVESGAPVVDDTFDVLSCMLVSFV